MVVANYATFLGEWACVCAFEKGLLPQEGAISETCKKDSDVQEARGGPKYF